MRRFEFAAIIVFLNGHLFDLTRRHRGHKFAEHNLRRRGFLLPHEMQNGEHHEDDDEPEGNGLVGAAHIAGYSWAFGRHSGVCVPYVEGVEKFISGSSEHTPNRRSKRCA